MKLTQGMPDGKSALAAGGQAIAQLAARMGVRESGVHPAFHLQAMLNPLFDVPAPHIATVHPKDHPLEDRLFVHHP